MANSTADGSVVIDVNMDVNDAEKKLADLKRKIFKLEDDIRQTTFKRDEAVNQYKKSLEIIKMVNEETEKGSKLTDIGHKAYQKAVKDVEVLKEEIKKYNADIKKSNLDLEATKASYGTIAQLAKELQEEEKARANQNGLQNLAEKAEIADQYIADLNQELLELKERQKELESVGIGLGYQEYDENSSRIAEITTELKEYKKTLQEVESEEEQNGLKNLAQDAEIADQYIVDLNEELLELKEIQKELESAGISFGYQEYDQNFARISEITRELREYQNALQENGDENSIFSKLSSYLVAGMERGLQAVKSFGSAAVNAFSKASISAIKFAKKINVMPKLFDSISRPLTRIGQMLRRVFVFSVFTSALRKIRQEVSLYLGLNEQFTTALRRLQGVLLTAFQPIYEVVVPALTSLINVLSRAIATVTQFFASLFGTTAKQAQANAKALYEQAHATKKAGKAAKEAAGSLAAFDEINTIQTENDSGGGADADANKGPLFDWEFEDTAFDSWGEAFSAFLDKLLAGIPKLEEAFKKFADWLNDFSNKLYDMFTFPGVLEKVEQLGRDLAGAFNKLVDWIDWNQLGKAIGAGLNLLLQFLTELLYNFDWMNLGRKLADFINGLVSEIDWYDFGRLLWAGFKIGLETLAGFLVGLDMPLLAKAASNIVMGFFDEMANTIRRIPWEELGRQIVRFFTSLDWAGMFSSVFDALGAVVDAIYAFLFGLLDELGERLDIHGITDPLIDMVKTVHDLIFSLAEATMKWVKTINLEPLKIGFSNLFAALSPLVSLIADGLLWAYENVLLPLASWVIEEAAPVLLNALAAAIEFLTAALTALKPIALFVFENILKPLVSFAWDVISGALQVITNILQKLTDLLKGNTTFSEFIDSLAPGEAIILGIAAALGVLAAAFAVHAVITAASAAISAAITAIGAALTLLNGPIGIVIGLITALVTAFTLFYQHSETFREAVNAIIENAKQIVPGIIAGIESAWEGFKSWWKNLWNGIIESFKSFFGIHSPSTLFAGFGKDLIAGFINGVSEMFGNVKAKFDELKNAVIDKINELKSYDWKSIGKSIVDGIKSGLDSAWSKVKNWASSAAKAVSSAFGGAKKAISSITSSVSSNSRMAAMPSVSTYSIPALAKGAVIPPNREFAAVLGDQHQGYNVEAPADLIRQMVVEGIKEAGISGNNQPNQINIMLDKRVLARVMVNEVNDMTRQNGKPVLLF